MTVKLERMGWENKSREGLEYRNGPRWLHRETGECWYNDVLTFHSWIALAHNRAAHVQKDKLKPSKHQAFGESGQVPGECPPKWQRTQASVLSWIQEDDLFAFKILLQHILKHEWIQVQYQN